jgi:hypothetical protein
LNADKDRAAGYKRGRCYTCRNCQELITVHNRQWDHVGGYGNDFMGCACDPKLAPGKQGQPVPWGTVQVFEEEFVPPQRMIKRDLITMSELPIGEQTRWGQSPDCQWRCKRCGRLVTPALSHKEAVRQKVCACLPIFHRRKQRIAPKVS